MKSVDLKIKVCGMRDPANVSEIVRLKPDYIGFILYARSPRFIEPDDAEKLKCLIPRSILRVGVLVNETLENAAALARKFDILQLHGNEDSDYCRILSGYSKIIKAFRISDRLPHDLSEYQPHCSMFLFDAAGDGFGGNGIKFDHSILENYNLDTYFILAGGISPEDYVTIKNIKNKHFAGVDINSRFEKSPGIKDSRQIKNFINKILEK